MGSSLAPVSSAPSLPPGYEWMEDVMAREQQASDAPPPPPLPPFSSSHPDPVVIGRTLVFEMPKYADWDELDQTAKMRHKRQYLCDRYDSINFIFEEDPVRMRNKNGLINVFADDYYALFEVWDSPNAEIQFHMTMILLERGLGLLKEDFKKLQTGLAEAAFEQVATAVEGAAEAAAETPDPAPVRDLLVAPEEGSKRRKKRKRPLDDEKKAEKKQERHQKLSLGGTSGKKRKNTKSRGEGASSDV